MKKIIIALTGIALVMGANSCNRKGCTDPLASNFNEKSKKDDGTCTYDANQEIKLSFTHNFNGSSVTENEFNQLNYKNAKGDTVSFTKLRYSISDSSTTGGKLDWISEISLNKKFLKEINNLKIGNYTKPMVIPGGFILIKLNNKKKDKKK